MSGYYNTERRDVSIVAEAFGSVLGDDKLVLIDGGAAGALSEPFDAIRELVQPIRFEARGSDTVASGSDDIYVDGGLWRDDGKQLLHVARDPSTSSICPPDEDYLKRFDQRIGWPPREPVQKIEVETRSIDSAVAKGDMPLPNIIKLDIHSSELPALEGAKASLDSCIALLVETWHSPVHKGQGLHCDVEKFAVENGFTVFDSVHAARWKHQFAGEVAFADRGQAVGSEMLFVHFDRAPELAVKLALTLALFRFGNEAKRVLAENSSVVGASDTDRLIRAITSQQEANARAIRRKPKYLVRKMIDTVRGRKSSSR